MNLAQPELASGGVDLASAASGGDWIWRRRLVLWLGESKLTYGQWVDKTGSGGNGRISKIQGGE